MGTLYVNTINEQTTGNGIKIPGHMVQAQHGTLAGSGDTTTSTSYIDQGLTINITPKYDDSKIFVSFSFSVRIRKSAHTRIDLRLLESGDSTEIWKEVYVGRENAVDDGDPIINFSGTGVYTTSDTNQKTFKMQVRKANGTSNESGDIYYKWFTGSVYTIQAVEIAQ